MTESESLQALLENPDNPEALFSLANGLYERELYGAALPYYLRVKELRPSHLTNRLNLAATYHRLGKRDQAEYIYSQLETLGNGHKPFLADVYANWSALYVNNDTPEKVVELADKSMEVRSGHRGSRPLISVDYMQQNQQLHQTRDDYGRSGRHYVTIVGNLIRDNKLRSVLDYGAGKCTLHEGIAIPNLTWRDYDPCVPELAERPEPAELVTCTDVMEHIEPDCLDAVLDDIQSLTKKMFLATVSLVPAIKILPDGRNAHLILQPYEWWLPKFWERWTIMHFQHEARAFLIICVPKGAVRT